MVSARRLLRLVSVNDVYSLENLPRLRSLVREAADGADVTLVTLAGDFVAPSLLSSIDAGRGMVDCLNAIGVTHVILGNHEDDLPPGEIWARIKDLRAKCLGTNIVTSAADLPRHDVVDVGGVKVGLVGVVMTAPTVYRGKPFDGAELLPANDAAIAEAARLRADGCAAVVPLTHQTADEDRELAVRQTTPPFPVIVGGHEHVPLVERIGETWLVKAGAEAANAVVSDLTFEDGVLRGAKTRLVDVRSFPEDAELRARVDLHMARVRQLAEAALLYLPEGPDGVTLSSIGTRRQQTSFGELVCSRLRDALGAEACVFNGGGIRAAREYTTRVTYGDVETEIPFDNEIVVVSMKGAVIAEAVRVSRAKAPVESGSFLQVDDETRVDAAGRVVAIAGDPFEPERTYRVALVRELLAGLDRIEPLVRWASENPDLVPPAGSGREPKLVLVQSFAIGLWRELGGFDAIDTDHDDRVTASEVASAVARAHPSALAVSSIVADLVVRAVDADADRIISRSDAEAVETEGET